EGGRNFNPCGRTPRRNWTRNWRPLGEGAPLRSLWPLPHFSTPAAPSLWLAARHAVPTMYHFREFAEAGGLVSYGIDPADVYRQVGVYTGRVLKGDKPAELPVMQATKFEFVINLKTARMLGLDVPLGLSAGADEVIE